MLDAVHIQKATFQPMPTKRAQFESGFTPSPSSASA
jgi:hypothetical protein